MFEPLSDGTKHPNGWRARLHVCGQYESRQLGLTCGVTHLVTIKSQSSKPFYLQGMPEGQHLLMEFEDTVDAAQLHAPPPEHVGKVCAWVDELPAEGKLIIHCLQGISRSTAVALGILSRYLPPEEAAEALHRVRPWADPNRLIVEQWDNALDHKGELQLVAALFPCKVWTSSSV